MSCRGGSCDGEGICPLGVTVPNGNPLKVRGGLWAPPPRNVFPLTTLFCFVVDNSVLGSDYNLFLDITKENCCLFCPPFAFWPMSVSVFSVGLSKKNIGGWQRFCPHCPCFKSSSWIMAEVYPQHVCFSYMFSFFRGSWQRFCPHLEVPRESHPLRSLGKLAEVHLHYVSPKKRALKFYRFVRIVVFYSPLRSIK